MSSGGTVSATSISGSTIATNFIFKFTLNTSTEMNVDINSGSQNFNITLNNQNITGYSIYLSDDYNSIANGNIYWKATTEYSYATTLATDEFSTNSISINCIENFININGLEYNQKFNIDVFDLSGKLVKQMDEKSALDIQELTQAVYILKLKTDNDQTLTKKIVKI